MKHSILAFALSLLALCFVACEPDPAPAESTSDLFNPASSDTLLRPSLTLAGDSLVIRWASPESDLVTGFRLYEALQGTAFEVLAQLPADQQSLALPLTEARLGRRLSIAVGIFGDEQDSGVQPGWTAALRTPPLLHNPHSGGVYTNHDQVTLQFRCDQALAMKVCLAQDSAQVGWSEYAESGTWILPVQGGRLPLEVYFRLPAGELQVARDSIAYDNSCRLAAAQLVALSDFPPPYVAGESLRLLIQLEPDALGAETEAQVQCNWPGIFQNLDVEESGAGAYRLTFVLGEITQAPADSLSIEVLDRAGNALHASVPAPMLAWEANMLVRTISGSGERAGMPIWLDGTRWPLDSPTTIHFDGGQVHDLRIGDATCTRASMMLSAGSMPEAEMLVDVGSVEIHIDAGPGQLVLDETETGAGAWQALDPPIESFFFSAYRPGFVAEPAFFRLGGLCGGTRIFTWNVADQGYNSGQLFPDFTLPRVQPGQTGTLGDFCLHQLRGRLVLVTFWYATCVNNLLEFPGFQHMIELYGSRGFRVMALDPYPADQPETYPQQVEDYDFIFLRDVGSPPVAQLAGVSAFPTNFLILPDGRIQSVRGGMSEEMLEELLLQYLPE